MQESDNNSTGKDTRDSNSSRSEEIQAIIDRMPTQWAKWVALLVSLLISTIIVLGFIIKYPDTVEGQITITANIAPVRLVSNSNGRIYLLKENKNILKKGDVISYIENGADYTHILLLDTLLNTTAFNKDNLIVLPDSLILGEVSSTYNAFALVYSQYQQLQSSIIYETMRQNLRSQINSDEQVIENVNAELELKKLILASSREQLRKDSILMSVKGISEQDYEKQRSTYLSLLESQLGLQSNKLMKQSEINRNQLEIQRITLEELESKKKAYTELITRKNELTNALAIWKERYLQYSPVAGELEYLGFWRNNAFIKSGQELFTVIPDKNDIVGEVMIPSYGAGKVKIDQSANVKINNFPYDEYGLLKGIVQSVSRITNKIETKEGYGDAYLVIVSFPNGTITNFGKQLPLDFETKGIVEIVTKRKRLIERLFDNLKSKIEK